MLSLFKNPLIFIGKRLFGILFGTENADEHRNTYITPLCLSYY